MLTVLPMGMVCAMRTKLDMLREGAAAGDKPLVIANRFPRLGEQAASIQRAHEALHSPPAARPRPGDAGAYQHRRAQGAVRVLTRGPGPGTLTQ